MKKEFVNDKIQQIPFGTNPNYKKQGAFVLIHAYTQPFLHYNSPKHDRTQKCLSFIVSNRRDNTKGFIGGTVDDGEDIIQALCREAHEEYGLKLDKKNLQPLCSHESNKIVGHLFEYQVNQCDFFDIVYEISNNFVEFYRKNAQFLRANKDASQDILKNNSREKFGTSHYYAETRNIEPMFVTDRAFEMNNLFSNLFAGTSLIELEIFLRKYEINLSIK